MRLKHSAFTMIELIFVIVIMGIIGKFGVEFLTQAYKSFINSKVNNELQTNSEFAVEFLAKRLEGRIKDSVIARKSDGTFVAVANAIGSTYKILEWVGVDEDGFRGITSPLWSGIIDLDESNKSSLYSPETNTTEINNFINALSYTYSDINDSALYFVGSDSDVITGYGWDGNAITDQNHTMHPIESDANISLFDPKYGEFKDIDVYEYYKLSWSAYAVVLSDDGNLTLYYNFQPWQGEDYNTTGQNVQHALIMQNISSFQFTAVGSIMKIQICTKSTVLQKDGGDYSLCKEKTIF